MLVVRAIERNDAKITIWATSVILWDLALGQLFCCLGLFCYYPCVLSSYMSHSTFFQNRYLPSYITVDFQSLMLFMKNTVHNTTYLFSIHYRGWVPKFATGLIYQIRHSSKSKSVIKLSFGQNNPPWENHFGKITVWSLVYFLNYAQFDILAQSQILGLTLYIAWKL